MSSRRSSQACKACRGARHRCIVSPAVSANKEMHREYVSSQESHVTSDMHSGVIDINNISSTQQFLRCERCKKLHLHCEWEKNKRFGRPKKRNNQSDSHVAPVGDGQISSATDFSTTITSSIVAVDNGSAFSDVQRESSGSVQQDSGRSASDEDPTAFLSLLGWHFQLPSSDDENLAPAMLDASMQADNFSESFNIHSAPYAPLINFAELGSGVAAFACLYPEPLPPLINHLYSGKASLEGCDIDGNYTESEKCLLLASSAYGFRLLGNDHAQSMLNHEAGLNLFFRIARNPKEISQEWATVFHETLILIQCGSILSRYAYGSKNLAESIRILLECRELAEYIGLPRIDRLEDDDSIVQKGSQNQNPEFSLSHVITQLPQDCPTYGVQPVSRLARCCQPCFLRVCRQTWWDIYFHNCTVYAATSQAGPLDDSIIGIQHHTVSAPRQEGDVLYTHFWQVYVRITKHVLECVDPNPPFRICETDGNLRLNTLNSVASSIAGSVQLLSDMSKSREHHRNPNINKIRSMTFILNLVLQASQISLHRNFWLAHRTSSVEFASRPFLSESVSSSGYTGTGDLLKQHLLSSLESIYLHSDLITTITSNADEFLTSNEKQETLETLQTMSPAIGDAAIVPPPLRFRSPTAACVQVAAVQGKHLILKAHILDSSCCGNASSWQNDITTFQLCICKRGSYRHEKLVWPPAKQMTHADPAYIAHRNKWLRLKSLQSIQISLDLLEDSGTLWPLSGRCKDDIELCQANIQNVVGQCGL